MVSIGFCGDSNVYGVGVTTQTRFNSKTRAKRL